MRKVLFLVFGLLLLSVSSVSAQTSSFAVTSIGTIDTSDGVLASYTYTNENPRIGGTAQALSEVTITIDDEVDTVTANASGVWTFTPTSLLDGSSYDITVESETDSESFTISISESEVDDADESETTVLPDTGFADYTYLLAFIAVVGMVASGVVILSK